MGLRGRLALFFVAITVVPLTIALLTLRVQVDRRLVARAQEELAFLRAAATALLSVPQEQLSRVADDLATDGVGQVLAAEDPALAQSYLRQQLEDTSIVDVVLLVGANGELLARNVNQPEFATGRQAPSVDEIIAAAQAETSPPGLLLAGRQITGAPGGEGPQQPLGWVITGVWLDQPLLADFAIAGQLAVVADDQVLASVGVPADLLETIEFPEPGEFVVEDVAGRPVLVSAATLRSSDSTHRLLVWLPRATGTGVGLVWFVLLPAVVAAALLGWLIAGTVVAPVEGAAAAALAVAAGDLNRKLEPAGGKELRALAHSFNTMSAELSTRLEQLENSRDELRGSLARLGETLSSSLDLNRTLAVVTETAMDTLQADRAILLLFTPERDALYTKVGRGVGDTPPRVAVGEGVAGWVAKHAVPVRLPADSDQVPDPAEQEPRGAQQLIVPMMGRGQVIGVLSLLRDESDPAFIQDDLDTIRSFAAQASVAIENVMLHQEAQRLSVTDTLTGLWNFRYFQLQAERELESASRFRRPLSMLIIDIDHFKQINDRHGHHVGDDALAEVARRIRDSTRVPDVVARYGGEEFVVLLPGTPLEGAVSTAERIRRAVSSAPVTRLDADGAPVKVTCSVGIAASPDHGATVAGLLRSADAAMYAAKRQGRDRVVAAGMRDRQLKAPAPMGDEIGADRI